MDQLHKNAAKAANFALGLDRDTLSAIRQREAEMKTVDIDDVSAHLNVNKEAVRRWIKTQGFPFHRAGNLFRFKWSEVGAWVCQDSEDSSSGEK